MICMIDKLCDFVDNMFSSESTFVGKGLEEEDIHSVIFIVFVITWPLD